MTPAISNYKSLAGQTVYWDTSDNQETYKKNLQDPEKLQYLQQFGYHNAVIEYQFNSHGFRTAEFDQGFDIVCFGDSYTMGTGVHSHQTWPAQLQQLTTLKTANLGQAGSSNDCAYRFAEHYLKYLRPRFAVWLQSDMHRIEILDDTVQLSINILASDTNNIMADNLFVKTWMTSESNQILNLDKNTRAFKNLCDELDIVALILPRSWASVVDLARDLRHPGAQSHRQCADKIKSMLEI